MCCVFSDLNMSAIILSGSFSLTLGDLSWSPKVALLVVVCSLPMPFLNKVPHCSKYKKTGKIESQTSNISTNSLITQ